MPDPVIHIVGNIALVITAVSLIPVSPHLATLPIVGLAAISIASGAQSSNPSIDRSRCDASEKESRAEPIPYEDWPKTCHICGDEINSQIRSQYVVQKGDNSITQKKSIPLCKEHTWTLATVIQEGDRIFEQFDDRSEENDIS